jgi:hypothetical protein
MSYGIQTFTSTGAEQFNTDTQVPTIVMEVTLNAGVSSNFSLPTGVSSANLMLLFHGFDGLSHNVSFSGNSVYYTARPTNGTYYPSRLMVVRK